MAVNWGSISAQLGALGLSNAARDAMNHGAKAEEARKEDLRRQRELDELKAKLERERKRDGSGR